MARPPILPSGGAPIGPPVKLPPGAVPSGLNAPLPTSGAMRLRGPGLVVRFSPIKGVTPKSVLGKRIWLPAVFGNFMVDEQATHNEYDTLSAGQFSQAAMGGTNARQLRSTSFDTLTIDFEPGWIVASGQDPWDLRVRLFEILRSKRPVQVLATFYPHPDPHDELFMSCTLRRVSREIRPAERETRYMTIEIKEWRKAAADRRDHVPAQLTSRKRGVKLPTTHALKSSDTLYSLAHEYYGNYEHWRLIRDANGIPKRFGAKTRIVTLGGHFKVGHKVKIPALPTGGATLGGKPKASGGAALR